MPENAITNKIDRNIQIIKNLGIKKSNSAWQNISDVYDVIKYIKDDQELKSKYESDDPKSIAKKYAEYYPHRNDEPVKNFVEIANSAYAYIFDSTENKVKYDNFLKYTSPRMNDIITEIKGLPKNEQEKPDKAKQYIDQIQEIFTDANQAISIYNIEAGLQDNPVLPPEIIYYAQCGSCGYHNPFDTETEMNSADKCKNCKESIYRQCPKCSKKVLVAMNRCKCGYEFANAKKFAEYIGGT